MRLKIDITSLHCLAYRGHKFNRNSSGISSPTHLLEYPTFSHSSGPLPSLSTYYFAQDSPKNSSKSLNSVSALSTAAKCPPISCSLHHTSVPVVSTQLLGTGTISYGNQEKPNSFLITQSGFSCAPIMPGMKNWR
jgi:hypothetical protein